MENQAKLRIERGNAALVNDDIEAAVGHFERSSRHFSGVDDALEAANWHECAMLLRYYGFRYKSRRSALCGKKRSAAEPWHLEEGYPHREVVPDESNALGGVSFPLAQFDIPENAMSHLAEAKGHYEDVRAVCSEEFLPKTLATAELDLANVYSYRRLAKSDLEYEANLQFALSLQLSALRFFSKSNDPTAWGILQHNLDALTSAFRTRGPTSPEFASDIEKAIHHLELSLERQGPGEQPAILGGHRAGRSERLF